SSYLLGVLTVWAVGCYHYCLSLRLSSRCGQQPNSSKSYGGPRCLLSFPTRRSSDLLRDLVHVDAALEHALGAVQQNVADDFARRSEEHTSELQSRENLVCRLLLEKKKHTRWREEGGEW